MAIIPNIKIPAQHLSAFKQICLLSEPDFHSLVETLILIPKGVNRKEFLTVLSEGLDFEHSTQIALAVFSLGNLLDSFLSVEQITEQLAKSFKISYLTEFENEVEEDTLLIFKNRVEQLLLHCDSLKPLFEALKIIDDSGNILTRTDILNPVHFLHENEFETKHAFQYFRLKLKYRFDGDSHEQSFSFDIDDLNVLKLQVDRALNSAQSFIINNPEINLIDISE